MAVNESNTTPMDEGDIIEFEKQKWDEPIWKFGEDAAWRVIGDDSEFRERVFSICINYTRANRAYAYANVERFIPSVAFDKKSRQEVQVRRRVINYASNGEVIFPTRTEPCFKFLRTHLPPNFTLQDWQPSLRLYKSLCEEQENIYNEELGLLADQQARAMQSQQRTATPHAELATAIAQGVVEALRGMGIKPAKP